MAEAKPIRRRQHLQDWAGKRFGLWTVLRFAEYRGQVCYWLCHCQCGTERPVARNNLCSGISTNCGCVRKKKLQERKKHGLSSSHEYFIYNVMLDRCYREGSEVYPYYGGRGIVVCERWRGSNRSEGFTNFITDIGRRPSRLHSLERNDNNGPYSPENCRWATKKEQGRNKRSNRLLTLNGQTRCIAEWAEVTGLRRQAINARLARGWSIEKTLMAPIIPM